MRRQMTWIVGSLLIALATSSFGLSRQKPPRLTGTVEGVGFSRVKIAVPEAAGDEGSRTVARELAETIRDDLEFSGFFDVIDPGLYKLVGPTLPGSIPFDDWLAIGADAVVASRATVSGRRIDLQAWLYDNPSRDFLMGHRYGGSPDLLRRIAHQLSDDLVQQYTGRPGIAMTRIAFVSRHEKGSELYLMDYDGRRIRRLTTTGTINLSPVWSPDGNRLAFVSWRKNRPDIYVMDSTGKLESVAALSGELNAAPDWSPDGKKIVYSSDASGDPELYILDLASGRHSRITHSRAIETAPAYSPNGREIAFTSDRSGTPQIYVTDTEGLNTRRISHEGSYNESPAWSPRGDKLAYVSRIDGRFDIVVMDLATASLIRLTRGDGNSENPRWSPDGRHIVFSSNRRGKYDIYTMASDGTDVHRLTRGTDSITPDWSR